MTHESFENVVQEQLTQCTDILCKKSAEYSSAEDKLHNFKNAAKLQCITQIQALSGMMAKHTISVYDMCMSGKTHPIELWEEKITDSINYLLLLKGMIVEEIDGSKTSAHTPTQAEYEELFAEEKPTVVKVEIVERTCRNCACGRWGFFNPQIYFCGRTGAMEEKNPDKICCHWAPIPACAK